MDQDLQRPALVRGPSPTGGNIIEIGTHSYRLAQTRSRHEAQQAVKPGPNETVIARMAVGLA
jgi:hypothetical protein